ncbi:AI-2E family transporter [Propylenella binzhouense]|uniref:AI-2E family transporter n=1 Tax=Propylenella binzhouense TaxID=2555902 RepID=A0A964WS19_9HYPH|nr:AI-2E family transporter [Propylenella binzhouense]MYZ46504.1 AI-2E family transporter [Propylenella binzhouense]
MEPAAGTDRLARSAVLISSIVLALATGLFIAWHAATALLLVGAGLIFAIALDAGARGLGRVIGGGRRLRLILTALVLVLLLGGAAAWSGASILQQAKSLLATLDQQVGRITQYLDAAGLLPSGGGGKALQGMLPSAGALFGGATNAIFATFGAVGNLVFVLFLAIFFAWEPEVYRAGFLSLVPPDKRPRLGEVLDKAGDALRGWLVGQAIGMMVIFLLTYVLLLVVGMPFALLLALQAGLFEFIPTIGPIAAGIAIVLAGLSEGPEMALWGVVVYILIQGVESNVLTPIVQEHTARLPPAFSLGMQLVLGALFGVLGIALAVPLSAAGKVIVTELYVRDALGGAAEERPMPERAGAKKAEG